MLTPLIARPLDAQTSQGPCRASRIDGAQQRVVQAKH